MESYAYWQSSGKGWLDEYRRRKTFLPYLNLQEVLIATVVSRAAPAKVLEYGSGVGRHLEYLSRIPGVSVHGYDQSPTMTSEMERWAPPGFVAGHVTIGAPVQRLPFADGEFDIVYTCEVLVHTSPGDLPSILSELVRVSKGLVFHLEPDPSVPLVADMHGGCWGHDLVKAYAELGHEARAMPRLFECQLPVAVERDPAAAMLKAVWPADIVADRFRATEENLRATLDVAVEEGVPDVDKSLDLAAALAQGGLSRLPRWALVDAVVSLMKERDHARAQVEQLDRSFQHARNFRCYVERLGPIAALPNGDEKGEADTVRIEVIEPNPRSHGSQAWLRYVRTSADAPAVPWSTLTIPADWNLYEAVGCTDDLALCGEGGCVDLPGGAGPVLNFMKHPWSGRVKVTWKNQVWIVDLYSSETGEVTLDLGALVGTPVGEYACQ
jgi:SAM-dependent methyltransferase